MKRAVPAVVLALGLSAAVASATEVGRVTQVVDGNTIKVRIGQKTETVSLIGVDTEFIYRQRRIGHVEDRLFRGFNLAEEAYLFTKRMSLGERVRLESDLELGNRNPYVQLLRYVYLPNGKLLNAEIIRQGYGTVYIYGGYDTTLGHDRTRRYGRMQEFRLLERDAREARRGMWAE